MKDLMERQFEQFVRWNYSPQRIQIVAFMHRAFLWVLMFVS